MLGLIVEEINENEKTTAEERSRSCLQNRSRQKLLTAGDIDRKKSVMRYAPKGQTKVINFSEQWEDERIDENRIEQS